ncbi:peptide deformylase [Alkalibacter saccharofermentans]|uniref:Peptide deformylase n=1 Tax=Alkalibacter saccharofermentans DSM 14828 TaxID=1120975 RepID=A0A1M4S4Y9_9FIRM|nr:peptide deformylase [Alkalibacter saccharofermentans]SHE27268.1 peptide deformylase [Alkalibacter saccharofermentans DSM 14828]
MALRTIREDGDPVLRKKARRINEITDRIITLRDDMIETMYEADGVGLAANQVGILRRIVVIDIGDGPITMINPEIFDEEGCQRAAEGCLSLPGVSGQVERPETLKVKFTDIDGTEKSLTAEGMLARAICHEVDHLDGILFTDRADEETLKEDTDS